MLYKCYCGYNIFFIVLGNDRLKQSYLDTSSQLNIYSWYAIWDSGSPYDEHVNIILTKNTAIKGASQYSYFVILVHDL